MGVELDELGGGLSGLVQPLESSAGFSDVIAFSIAGPDARKPPETFRNIPTHHLPTQFPGENATCDVLTRILLSYKYKNIIPAGSGPA